MGQDDSTLGGLSPLTAILIVLALAALGGLLFGATATRRHRVPERAEATTAAATPQNPTRSRRRRVVMWTLRRAVRMFT